MVFSQGRVPVVGCEAGLRFGGRGQPRWGPTGDRH